MQLIDWVFTFLPLVVILGFAFYTRRFVQGVADYMSAGRCAGRYLMCNARAEADSGLSNAVANFQSIAVAGFVMSWWGVLSAPLFLILGIVGFVTYRYRETRVLTLPQFFEVRYSKNFRLFMGLLAFLAGVLNYGIFPAVAGKFFVAFLQLDPTLAQWGMPWMRTDIAIMASYMTFTLVMMLTGGQITLMVTDCLEGIFSHAIYLLIVIVLLWLVPWGKITWWLTSGGPDKSLINPFDAFKVKDFNIYLWLMGLYIGVYITMAWQNRSGFNSAGRTPHETRMGGVLGHWRGYARALMLTVLVICALTYLKHPDYVAQSTSANHQITQLLDEQMGEKMRVEIGVVRTSLTQIQTQIVPAATQITAVPAPKEALLVQLEQLRAQIKQLRTRPNEESAMSAATSGQLGVLQAKVDKMQNEVEQTLTQVEVPIALSHMLPGGVKGLFVLVMIMGLMAADASHMHSWGSILVQDVVLPLRGRPMAPNRHVWTIRFAQIGVGVFAFCFSILFKQTQYIWMWWAITGAVFQAGAGAVIIGGLYWKRGTAAGAWVAGILGAVLSLFGILADTQVCQWLTALGHFIGWESLPANAVTISFLIMVIVPVSYVVVSLLTPTEAFNMDRMLHRGIYRVASDTVEAPHRPRGFIGRILGFDDNFTLWDKLAAGGIFWWTMFWLAITLVGTVWNCWRPICRGLGLGGPIAELLQPWSQDWWLTYWLISGLILPFVISAVTFVWFGIGGFKDLKLFFHALHTMTRDHEDDGRVVAHKPTESPDPAVPSPVASAPTDPTAKH
ncbi:MAG: hypothetical protein WCJ97_07615 [Phycisphaerae bacterium]